ncbi:MAG: hypothetical protein LBG58_01355 [Planctomycetaceae bacterium]|jgi:predicted PurR-regulated permease PerM|nr:hypothetical protein [Planctomycetaceae bacterium]
MVLEIATILLTQCPVIGGLIWFLVTHTKETNRRFAEQATTYEHRLSEQAKIYETTLDKIVDRIGVRVDIMDDKIDTLKLEIKNIKQTGYESN